MCWEFDEDREIGVEKPLKNVTQFIYLGSLVEGGKRTTADIEHRMVIGQKEFRVHKKIWKSQDLLLKQKLSVYSTYIVSTATHGHEGWCFDDAGMSKINGFNASCLARITGRSIEEMSRHGEGGAPFDLVTYLRKRRLQWCGHLLRMGKDRDIHNMLNCIYNRRHKIKGTILQDVPETKKFEELMKLAVNRKEWRQRVRELDPRGAEKALTQCSLTRDSRSVKAIRVVQNLGDSPRRTE